MDLLKLRLLKDKKVVGFMKLMEVKIGDNKCLRWFYRYHEKGNKTRFRCQDIMFDKAERYAGFNDCKDAELYEGDVCRFVSEIYYSQGKRTESHAVGVIILLDGCFVFSVKNNSGDGKIVGRLATDHITKIGDIHGEFKHLKGNCDNGFECLECELQICEHLKETK